MRRYDLWLLVIILIALALRLYNLTYHSLWFDEAISVFWARQSVPRILEVGFTLVEDRLPPLFYLTLKGWASVFSYSETSLRLLSVLFGVLLVPVIAWIAIALFNRRVALITALLVALNPFLIWYAQEVRMYASAVLFSILTIWAFLQWLKTYNLPTDAEARPSTLDDPRPSLFTLRCSLYGLAFILFAIAGLYSHLYTSFLLPALGLWLIVSYSRAWQLWFWFAICGLIITVAFTPLALATWRFSGEAAPGDPFRGLGQRAWWLLQSFTVWKAPLSPTLKTASVAIVAIFALAAYLPINNTPYPAEQNLLGGRSTIQNGRPLTPRFKNPLVLISLLLLIPFVIANILLFRNHLAFFGERYFIVMVPWLLLLAAVGADNLSKWIYQRGSQFKNVSSVIPPPAPRPRHAGEGHALRFSAQPRRGTLYASRLLSYTPYLLLLIATIIPLPGQWSIPAAKEAWRQSVAFLAQQAKPDHGILIHPDWVRHPFQFYFQGPGQTYAAFSNVTAETLLDGPLQGVVGDHPVIWLIQSHLDAPDPDHQVEQWFAARYPLVTELYPPGISLKGYAPGYQLKTLPLEAIPVDIQFENGMALIGYQSDYAVSAVDPLFHPPSGWIHVTLYWTAPQLVSDGATPYVQLVGPEGVWGVSLERSNDALKLYPPSQWRSSPAGNAIVRHDVDVNLNPVTPPGTYQLVVGLHGYEGQYPLTEVEIR